MARILRPLDPPLLFATNELYSNFMNNFEKGFQPQQPVDDMKTFKTHIQNQKCIITAHESEKGLCVKGPGHKLWKEKIFSKLAIKLYRQYEHDVNEHLDGKDLGANPAPTLSNAPSIQGINDDVSQPTLSAQLTSEGLLKSVEGSQREMKEQMVSVMEMFINLQGEFNELKTKSNSAKSETARIPTVTVDLTNSNNEEQNQGTSHDEVLHQEDPPNVPVDINYSEVVQFTPLTLRQTQSTSDRRKEQRPFQSTPRNIVNNEQNKKTLLIGDSLLSGVNVKGLKNYVHCQPIPGATINKVKEKITMYDLSEFKNIIIYCGGNDSADSEDLEVFKNSYEDLLQYIRSKNPDCTLFLCNSCPRGDTDTRAFNSVIKTLAEYQGHKFVNAYDSFYDNNDELRTRFYGVRDWIHLSSSGIRRLLGTIHEVLPIVEDFRYCAYPQEQISTSKPLSHKYRRDKHRYTGNRQSYRPSTSVLQTSRDNQSHYQSSQYNIGGRQTNDYTNDYREQTETSAMGHQTPQWGSHHVRSQQFSREHEDYRSSSDYNYQIERCMKCGLTNHTTIECRHKRQLLCYVCNFYGHKDSICWNQ